MRNIIVVTTFLCCQLFSNHRAIAQVAKTADAHYDNEKKSLLSVSDYTNRVHAIWLGQMAAACMGFQFEHHTASTEWIDKLPPAYEHAPVDDDWYYEMITIRGFERYGIDMTVQQLGQQWKENSCGSWGSSEQTRLLLNKGIPAVETGLPKYNKLWFSIGPQFSADIYGALAPGLPNVAGMLARNYSHINGYAEGVDGAVFVAGMISISFFESDCKTIVRKAAALISPQSPYRQCLDLVIKMGEQGRCAREVFDAVEDRWHIEYPATNNAVANGGIVAASVWFGEGDFLKTINLAFGAADFTDADCNAANAASVVAAMKGINGIPGNLIKPFNDRIKDSVMGEVKLTPAVDESISGLAARTAVVGQKIMAQHGIKSINGMLTIPLEEPVTQLPEIFKLADLARIWNPDWQLERAGFGGAGGGMPGIHGNTYLNGDVLATYPRDEIRGLKLERTVQIGGQKALSFEAGVDAGRAWDLSVFINNVNVLKKHLAGTGDERKWEAITIDLTPFKGKKVVIRIYQLVLVNDKEPGNAYWKNLLMK